LPGSQATPARVWVTAPAERDKLDQVLERLERIEKRLDQLEKSKANTPQRKR